MGRLRGYGGGGGPPTWDVAFLSSGEKRCNMMLTYAVPGPTGGSMEAVTRALRQQARNNRSWSP